MKRIAMAFILAVLMIGVMVPTAFATPATLEVGKGKTYDSIGDAIIAASNGDTILIYPGTYKERPVVDKEVTIKAAKGRPHVNGGFWIDVSNVVIEGLDIQADPGDGSNADVIHVDVDTSGVTIRNNHITGGGRDPADYNAGIALIKSKEATVEGNFIHMAKFGIYLGNTSNSLIKDNHVVNAALVGIDLTAWPAFTEQYASHHNTVVGNKVFSSGLPDKVADGILMFSYAHDNIVEDNHVSGATQDGIRAVATAYDNMIKDNKAKGNRRFDINDEDSPPSDNTWNVNQFNKAGGSASG